jgi:hypothetical protein
MSRYPLAALAALVAATCQAKPIAFANGTTLMAESGAGTMTEMQVFYAPRYNYSVGGGHVDLTSELDGRTRHISYARLNALLHRWNMDAAQANLFIWGGAGAASGNSFAGTRLSWHTGAQADFETRRVYASVKTDQQYSAVFSHRINTLQLGLAPYKHDYAGLATWLVVQARQYSGGLFAGTESALLLRLFKASAWLEAGITNRHKLQAMAMFNF